MLRSAPISMYLHSRTFAFTVIAIYTHSHSGLHTCPHAPHHTPLRTLPPPTFHTPRSYSPACGSAPGSHRAPRTLPSLHRLAPHIPRLYAHHLCHLFAATCYTFTTSPRTAAPLPHRRVAVTPGSASRLVSAFTRWFWLPACSLHARYTFARSRIPSAYLATPRLPYTPYAYMVIYLTTAFHTPATHYCCSRYLPPLHGYLPLRGWLPHTPHRATVRSWFCLCTASLHAHALLPSRLPSRGVLTYGYHTRIRTFTDLLPRVAHAFTPPHTRFVTHTFVGIHHATRLHTRTLPATLYTTLLVTVYLPVPCHHDVRSCRTYTRTHTPAACHRTCRSSCVVTTRYHHTCVLSRSVCIPHGWFVGCGWLVVAITSAVTHVFVCLTTVVVTHGRAHCTAVTSDLRT